MRVGIDIGGTKANLLLLNDQAEIINRKKLATGTDKNCENTIKSIADSFLELIHEMNIKKEEISFVGAGVPGTVDPTSKIVVNAPNLFWKNEPVAEYFEKYSGIKIRLIQDTRAAAWAEARRLPNKKCVVCVTLGTGIGCGIVINGHIWHGALGTAGEIGHIPVKLAGRKCNCGRSGCMEAYASGLGLEKTSEEYGISVNSEGLFNLAKEGNCIAKQIIDEAIQFITQDLTAVINILSPDVLLFSGGLSKQKELYVDPIIKNLKEAAYKEAVSNGLTIDTASLDVDAPAIGAAFLNESECFL